MYNIMFRVGTFTRVRFRFLVES